MSTWYTMLPDDDEQQGQHNDDIQGRKVGHKQKVSDAQLYTVEKRGRNTFAVLHQGIRVEETVASCHCFHYYIFCLCFVCQII